MHRQKSLRLTREPLLRLLVLTGRTVTVAARTPDPVAMATAGALEERVAEFARATTDECAQHLTLSPRDAITPRLEILWRVLAQSVRDGWHRLDGGAETLLPVALEDPLDGTT